MQTILLYLHSGLRYLIIILLLWSLSTAITGLVKRKEYTERVRKIYTSTRMLLNLQMLIGLALYFMMGFFHLLGKLGSISDQAAFFTIAHISGMIVGITLINIGYFLATKAETDRKKYKRITIFYGIGSLIIFLMIPWPFFHSWATWF